MTRRSRTWFAAIGVFVLCAAGVGGYLVGQASAPDDDEIAMVRDLAEEEAREEAEDRAFAEARDRGVTAGRQEGRRAGREQAESDAADEEPSSEVAGPGEGCGEVDGFPGGGLVAVQVEEGSAPCDEVRDVFSDLFAGEGVSLGSTAEGTQVGDWTCFPTRMGSPSGCVRGEEPDLTRVSAADGSGN
jgi:hypothetical protein